MKWRGRSGSRNVEDRRGRSGRSGQIKLGLFGTLLVIALALMFGENPLALLQQVGVTEDASEAATIRNADEDEMAEFVAVVLKDTEDVWQKVFREQLGQAYREPVLVLFTNSVTSACGMASSATGPFYCPGDDKLYIDLSFYDELKTRFGAPGDFAMAYVVAHEVGHHVQNLLGISGKVQSMRRKLSEEERNQLSVRLELQADFLAGLWAHHAQKMKDILEQGDVEEALAAANAIGDDRLQKQARGYVVPESFTHGTSAQRMQWFQKGLQSGQLADGDTFATDDL